MTFLLISVYMILYEEVDESDVDILHLSSPTQDSDDEFRYPRAGEQNNPQTTS